MQSPKTQELLTRSQKLQSSYLRLLPNSSPLKARTLRMTYKKGYAIQENPFVNLPNLPLQQQSEDAMYSSLKRSQYSQMSYKSLLMSLPEKELTQQLKTESKNRQLKQCYDEQNAQIERNNKCKSSLRDGFTQHKIIKQTKTQQNVKYNIQSFKDLKEQMNSYKFMNKTLRVGGLDF